LFESKGGMTIEKEVRRRPNTIPMYVSHYAKTNGLNQN
jgi:hypothetical protein